AFGELNRIGFLTGECSTSSRVEPPKCKFYGAQAAGCSPISTAVKSGWEAHRPVRKPNTIAKSLAIGDPADGYFANKIIRETGGKTTVEVSGTTVKGVLDDLGAKHPGITQRLFNNGQLRQFVNIYVNNEDIRYLQVLDTPVKDGDELAIIPAVAGG